MHRTRLFLTDARTSIHVAVSHMRLFEKPDCFKRAMTLDNAFVLPFGGVCMGLGLYPFNKDI